MTTQKQPTATESVTIVSAGADSCIGKLFNDVNGNILAVSGGAVKLYIITLSDGAAVRDSEAAATVAFTGSAAGSCYYQVVESGAAVPGIDTTGTGISCISGENRISIAGLSDAEAKDIYICVKDEYGVVSNVLKVEIPVYTAPSVPSGSPEITGVADGEVYYGGGTVTPTPAPEMIGGKNQTVTAGTGSTLTFRSNAAFADFIRVELDGVTVDESSYTKSEGSTIITLNAEFVAGIPVGIHQLGIVSNGGTATTTFEVIAPATGDAAPLVWATALLLFGCGVYAVSWSVGRKQGMK